MQGKSAYRHSFAFSVLVILMLTACGSLLHHYVRKGETLYSISFRYGQDYRDVARWNDIKPPYIIKQGQLLRIAPPADESSRPAGQPEAVASVSESRQATVSRPAAPAPAAPAAEKIIWRWPATGKLLSTFANNQPGRQGIKISAREGTPVRAAAAGRVVYAGDGLKSYGKLLIIKHNEKYLSAYAHNRKLLVEEGEQVNGGQMIAEMGRTGSTQVMLHFEIRVHGQPLDPLKFLPSR